MIGKCCCILIGLFAGFLVFIGISTLVYVLVIAKTLPKALVHYEVTNASLTKFDLTGDSTFLDYNLTLNITLENPSPLNYNFNQLAAMPVFKNQTLNDMTNLSTSFYLEHETNAMFPALFSANSLAVFGAQEAFGFRNASVFDIVLKINSQYWAKSKKKKTTFKQEMACYLKVPLNSNGTSSAGDSFQITKCKETKLDIDVD